MDFATPNGIVATIDKESINDKYWKDLLEVKNEALIFAKNDSLFNKPLTLEKAIGTQSNYIGLVIPGGQGLMVN